MIVIAFMVLREAVASTVDIPTFTLDPQQAELLIALKAALLIILLLPNRQRLFITEVVKVFAGRGNFRLGGGDW